MDTTLLTYHVVKFQTEGKKTATSIEKENRGNDEKERRKTAIFIHLS
jgi:hypothetical protein